MRYTRSGNGLTHGHDWTAFSIAVFRMSTPFIAVLDKAVPVRLFFVRNIKSLL